MWRKVVDTISNKYKYLQAKHISRLILRWIMDISWLMASSSINPATSKWISVWLICLLQILNPVSVHFLLIVDNQLSHHVCHWWLAWCQHEHERSYRHTWCSVWVLVLASDHWHWSLLVSGHVSAGTVKVDPHHRPSLSQ